MGDYVLTIDDEYDHNLKLSSGVYICRICHEQEFEASQNLEAPCACSGTVKFAHRDCIQRWCDEKGNTVCEICLQKFEPGYTAPSKKAHLGLVGTTPTIRVSNSEISRRESDEEEEDGEMVECCSTSRANCCRSMALTFTFLLLMRHLLGVFTGETRDYPFSLLTLLIVKASGIILPMYLLIQLINKIHITLTPHNQNSDNHNDSSSDDEDFEIGRVNNLGTRPPQ